jgi:hypothetical protein
VFAVKLRLACLIKTTSCRLPCVVFREELKRLSSYVASRYISHEYANSLRAKILKGAFNTDTDKLKDVLAVIEMSSASELTVAETVLQLRMRGCFDEVDESLVPQITGGPQVTSESESVSLRLCNSEKRTQTQTQLDDAGFVRSKPVRLSFMNGQASFSDVQAPRLPNANTIFKPFVCPKCSMYFATTQALGAHLAKKHADNKQASRHNLLSNNLIHNPLSKKLIHNPLP